MQCCKRHLSFEFKPDWGFNELGFTFWNWAELKQTFINDFKKRLACDVAVVFQHI
jgi:hypothetical protein